MSNEFGTLFVVATPIGNMADITLHALEVLARVGAIAAEDTRHTGQLLRQHGIQNRLVSLHEHNERERIESLVVRLLDGEDLALVSDAGTPLLSDPGFPLVRACHERGIPVRPLPGASALLAALSVAGLPTDRFRFEGFPPRKTAARQAWIEAWSRVSETIVFYESAHRIEETLADLAGVLGETRFVVVARELTKQFETLLRGTLGELVARLESDPDQRKGEFVVLVAGVEHGPDGQSDELDRVLGVLLGELPVKQAAALAARIVGVPRNRAYERALALRGGIGG